MAGWNIAPKCNFWVGSGTFWEWFSKLSSNLFTQLCNTGFFKKISPVCMQDQCGIIVLVYQEIVWASKWFRPQILTGVKGMLTHNIADEREGREEVHSIHSRGGIIPFLLLSMTISHPQRTQLQPCFHLPLYLHLRYVLIGHGESPRHDSCAKEPL